MASPDIASESNASGASSSTATLPEPAAEGLIPPLAIDPVRLCVPCSSLVRAFMTSRQSHDGTWGIPHYQLSRGRGPGDSAETCDLCAVLISSILDTFQADLQARGYELDLPLPPHLYPVFGPSVFMLTERKKAKQPDGYNDQQDVNRLRLFPGVTNLMFQFIHGPILHPVPGKVQITRKVFALRNCRGGIARHLDASLLC